MSTDSDIDKKQQVAATNKREVVIGNAVKREFKALPESIRDQFLTSLKAIVSGIEPLLEISHLTVPKGLSAIELKINGSPAYRCVYTTKIKGKIHVVYAGKKTAQGTDRQLMETAIKRLKAIR